MSRVVSPHFFHFQCFPLLVRLVSTLANCFSSSVSQTHDCAILHIDTQVIVLIVLKLHDNNVHDIIIVHMICADTQTNKPMWIMYSNPARLVNIASFTASVTHGIELCALPTLNSPNKGTLCREKFMSASSGIFSKELTMNLIYILYSFRNHH